MLYFSEAVLQRFFSKVFCKHGQLYWNRTSAWVFPHKFTAYLQNNFFEEHLWVFIFSGKVVKKEKKKNFDTLVLKNQKRNTNRRYVNLNVSVHVCFLNIFINIRFLKIKRNVGSSLCREACDRTHMRKHVPKSTYVYQKCTLK